MSEDYVLVKETMLVSRYHLVKGAGEQAIEHARECDDEAEYLQSCDELDWDSTIEYEVIPLPENWKKDLRIVTTRRHIEERLSKEPVETDLTKRRRKGIIKKRSKKASKKQLNPLDLLKEVKP